MAFLTPDATYTTKNGIVVHRKFLPAKQRPNKKLNTAGNKPQWITIHNTEDINEAAGTNDAEQYARATFNGNMGNVTVHLYVDETDCWQILPFDEMGYHAGDYSNKAGGNWTSIGVEIIEWDLAKVETKKKAQAEADNKKAEDRGARIAAWLLYQYGLSIDRLTTHQHWNGKYCPAIILPHWATFKATVEKYLKALQAADKPQTPATSGTKKIYRVQVGAYSVKANAEAMQKKLKAAGFDAIIKEE